MATLPNGTSEIDTVVLRLPDYQKEIVNWSQYQFSQKFLVPTSGWSFSFSDEDTTLTNELLVPNAYVELVINNNVQCAGYIEEKTIETSPGGTTVTVQGRDILGPVVTGTVDPIFKFTPGITVPELVLSVLKPFGITTIYNADAYNLYVISGYEKGGAQGQPVTVKARVQQSTPNADGTVTLSYTTADSTMVLNPLRPDLRQLQADQIKPHSGEGAYAYLERLLRRLGLTLWAMADGSGVVIDKADFTSPPQQSIVHKRTDGSQNNVLHGRVTTNISSQPSCIVATGFGSGRDTEKAKMRVIMVNELVGLDDSGNPLPEIQNLKARYKSAKVLPIRKELVPFKRPLGDRKIVKVLNCKDDESKTIAQLEAFVRREMANHQQGALQVSYELVGYSSDGKHPWAVNTLVSVQDEVLGITENLWVLEKTFTKSSGGGTKTALQLIRPFTLQIAT